MTPEEIVEQILEDLDHRHYGDDFKASLIVKKLAEAGYLRKAE